MQRLFNLLILTILLTTKSTCSEREVHLVLHFTIDSIVLFDDSSTDQRINELLSDTTSYTWDATCKSSISFTKFLQESHLTYTRSDFLEYVKKEQPSQYTQLLDRFSKIKARIKTNPLAPAFARLINLLETHDISYSLILRTYGPNLEKTMETIHSQYNILFPLPMRFQDGVLEDTSCTIFDMHEIYQAFKQIPAIGIRDDYAAWQSHQKEKGFGKPFPIDTRDAETICLFFENCSDIEKDSIAPFDVRTNTIPNSAKELGDHKIIAIDPARAYLSDMYLIDELQKIVQID